MSWRNWPNKTYMSSLNRFAVSGFLFGAMIQAQAQSFNFKNWFDREIGSRVTVTGYRRLAYHSRTVDGDTESYGFTEYGGKGLDKFTDFGQVHVSGSKVLGVANFELNIQDSRFNDPQTNRVSVDIDRGPWTANFGDIRATLADSNRFTHFDKSLTGGTLGYRTKKLEARVVHSEIRGEPRSVSLQGNNSAGPYYLQSSQIARGTETIVVDGVVQKFGTDYTMDYEIGSVSFINSNLEGRIIPPTSTIVATYEVFGLNGSKGTLQGAELNYDLGKIGKIGLSAMRQKQGGAARDSTFQQQFLGPIAAGTALILQYEPLDILTVRVFIGSQLQALNRDYRFNTTNKSILILLREVPGSTVMTVVYNPKPVNTATGDREVFGLAYRLPLGDQGSLTFNQATGRLTNSVTPKSGTARGLDVRYRLGKAEISGSLTDVPSEYVSIETIGLERNEKAARIGVNVRPNDRFDYGFEAQDRKIQTLDSTNKFVTSRFSRYGVFTNFKPKGRGLPYHVTQTRTTSKGPGSDTTLDHTSIGTSGSSGRTDWRLDLGNQFATGIATVNSKRTKRKLNLQSLDYHMNYRSSAALTFDFGASVSRVATPGESSMGRDLSLNIDFRPYDGLTVRSTIADSDAGQLATLGFINGNGFGYGGNGFTGGTDQSNFSGVSNSRVLRTDATWAVNDKLTLNGSANYVRSNGGLSANSETTGFGIGANWSLGNAFQLDALLDTSRTSFLDSNIESSASTFGLFATGNPKGNLSFRAGLNALLTGGNSQFNQDSLGYEASLTYRLARRHALTLASDNGRLTGYLPQVTRSTSLTYQYQIWKSLALNVGYRLIDVVNRDPSATSGAYSSRGFDIELEFNFGR